MGLLEETVEKEVWRALRFWYFVFECSDAFACRANVSVCECFKPSAETVFVASLKNMNFKVRMLSRSNDRIRAEVERQLCIFRGYRRVIKRNQRSDRQGSNNKAFLLPATLFN